MTKTFAWVRSRNTAGLRPDPQPIIYDKPLVGSRMEFVPNAERELEGDDLNKSLDELASDYPAPPVDHLKVGGA
ncbi:MAG: hypothetical protein V4458_05995 [Pseudomonadota bacterium]